MKQALIVIDMLNDFFDKNASLSRQRKKLCANINDLARFARKNGLPIIWVKQEFKPDLSDAFLIMRKKNISITIKGTPGSDFVRELNRKKKDFVIIKKRYSAFFRTNIDKLLHKLRIDTLIITGINSHACIRTAAIDAYQRDLNVIIAKDCVASYDRKHHEISLNYLQKSMGIQILSNDEIISLKLNCIQK